MRLRFMRLRFTRLRFMHLRFLCMCLCVYFINTVVSTATDAAAYSEVFALQVRVFGPWSMHTDEVCRRCLVRAAAALLTSNGSMGSGGGGGAGSSGGQQRRRQQQRQRR